MKLKVEKVFTDKITGEIYTAGQEIEVASERGKELLADARKLVSEIKSKSASKTSSKKTTKK